jgi:hypothetical protein
METWERSSVDIQGCQIFLGPNIPKRENYTKGTQTIPNDHKIYDKAVKYPNGHTIYKHFQDPPKNTQIGIFGMNMNHLANLQEWNK